jgi:hypothetical protein
MRCGNLRRWPMLDWQKLVREQLVGLNLGHQEQDEVVAELADHLQEAFESLCREGMSEQGATRRALAQAADWNALRRKIYLARNKEDIIKPRVTRFWLPGLLGFALAMILEVASYRFDSHPLVLSLDRGTPVLRFHISWIFALLLVGAIAAYLSRRAGGTLRTSLLSSIFPVVPFAAVFLFAIPIGLITGHSIAYNIVAEQILYMALGWVLAPAAALLTGGLFVQRFLSGGSRSSRGVNAGVA